MANRVDSHPAGLRSPRGAASHAGPPRHIPRASLFVRVRIVLGIRLLPLACRLFNPFLVALALAMHARPWSRDGEYRVLVISKDILNEDVRALSMYGQRVAFTAIAAGVVKKVYSAATHNRMNSLNPRDYFSGSEYDAEKERYHSFLLRMLPWLLRFLRVDAVMAANWTYVSHIGLARALKEMRVPFIVLYKEGQIVPGRVEQQRDAVKSLFYNGPIYARAVFTYNEMVAQRIDGMKMPGITREDIRPVGPPRMDFYRRNTEANERRKQITFFVYSPFSSFYYFEELARPETGERLARALEERTLGVYRTVLEFAERNPDCKILFKCKHGSEGLNYAMKALSELGDGRFDEAIAQNVDFMVDNSARLHRNFCLPGLDNVEINDTANARDLILSSQAIVALNSITTIEALMAGTRILIPDHSELFPGVAWNYFHTHPHLVNFFSGATDIEATLEEPMPGGAAFERDRDAFLQAYLVQGMSQLSSHRLERELITYIDEQAIAAE